MNRRIIMTERPTVEHAKDPRRYFWSGGANRTMDCHYLQWRIEGLEALNADLVAALVAVEWVCDAGLWYCPCCKQQRTKGHKTNCQLAAALAKAKGE